MSTRSQIDFVVKGEYKNKKGEIKTYEDYRRVYRHSDGYPKGESGVIADLKTFLRWNEGRNEDVEYTAANFIYWSKRRMEENYFTPDKERSKWSDNGSTNCSILHIGFGVCDPKHFHGDIEYYYRVVIERETPRIEVYKVERENWNKPVTMKNMKLIETVKLLGKKTPTLSGSVISQPSL